MSRAPSPTSARVALVSGASGKTGRALSHRLRAEGITVLGVARDVAGWRREMDRSAAPGAFVAHRTDLTDERRTQALLDRVLADHDRVDILLHLAAVRVAQPIDGHDVDSFRAALDTALVGGFLLMRRLVPRMADAGWGRVISFGGTSAQTGAADRTAVTAAKAGLMGLSRSVAREVAGRGVTVNVVSPGSIADPASPDTPRGAWPPVGRSGSVDEVVALCAYLWSDAAAYVTGQTFNINGGRLMT